MIPQQTNNNLTNAYQSVAMLSDEQKVLFFDSFSMTPIMLTTPRKSTQKTIYTVDYFKNLLIQDWTTNWKKRRNKILKKHNETQQIARKSNLPLAIATV